MEVPSGGIELPSGGIAEPGGAAGNCCGGGCGAWLWPWIRLGSGAAVTPSLARRSFCRCNASRSCSPTCFSIRSIASFCLRRSSSKAINCSVVGGADDPAVGGGKAGDEGATRSTLGPVVGYPAGRTVGGGCSGARGGSCGYPCWLQIVSNTKPASRTPHRRQRNWIAMRGPPGIRMTRA